MRGLLFKLQAIFDLPKRLHTALEQGAVEIAVNAFADAAPLLKRYGHKVPVLLGLALVSPMSVSLMRVSLMPVSLMPMSRMPVNLMPIAPVLLQALLHDIAQHVSNVCVNFRLNLYPAMCCCCCC